MPTSQRRYTPLEGNISKSRAVYWRASRCKLKKRKKKTAKHTAQLEKVLWLWRLFCIVKYSWGQLWILSTQIIIKWRQSLINFKDLGHGGQGGLWCLCCSLLFQSCIKTKEYQLNNYKQAWSNCRRKSLRLFSDFPVLHLLLHTRWLVCSLLPLAVARGQEICFSQRTRADVATSLLSTSLQSQCTSQQAFLSEINLGYFKPQRFWGCLLLQHSLACPDT